MSEEETRDLCPNLDKVQRLVDDISKQVRSEYPNGTPQWIGTQIHSRLAVAIGNLGNPNLRAEISFTETQEFAKYGTKYSIIVDVFDRTDHNTVCAYDIKTGDAELTPKRADQMFGKMYKAFEEKPSLVIVIEVRPRK